MPIDQSSFSNLNEITTSHLNLNWVIDFSRKILHGSAQLSMKALKDDVQNIVLDTSHINILSVEMDGKPLQYSLAERDPKLGSALTINLPEALVAGTTFDILVTYETTSGCTAMQWLNSEQTAGKIQPYLFTQCEAIHARSMIPHQDSPSIKLTYAAEVRSPLRVLMSGLEIESNSEDGYYRFEQRNSIPSYLIALVSGNLVQHTLSPSSAVWAEPEVVAAAAWEFAEIKQLLESGESLLTPYQWGRFDLLVLPPSFPFGGMENPNLIFVTPTLLSGDRSSVGVIAHELSHSWTGNLVTANSWSHFWLNEGWTTFLERKIIGRTEGEKMSQFHALLGVNDLKASVDLYGETSPLTALVPDMRGVDPDDSYSSIPYEKGFHLLYYLEQHLGGPPVFEPYIRDYIKEFSGKSIDSEQWRAHLIGYFEKNHDSAISSKLHLVNWDAWLYGPGMPPVKNDFDTTLADQCVNLVNRWKDALAIDDYTKLASSDIESFAPIQKMYFLEKMFELAPVPPLLLQEMDKLYGFSLAKGSEILFRWLKLCISSDYSPAYQPTVTFITSQGRMKFIRPLYRALNQAKGGRELAKSTFAKYRAFYHPIAAAMIEKDLA